MTTPVIEIGDSASHSGGSAIVGPWSIGQDLASLIANSSSAITASGAKIIKLDAGSLSLCSTLQVGNEKDGVVCTKEMVAANQTLLNQLGAYCRANGISVRIEAALSGDDAARSFCAEIRALAAQYDIRGIRRMLTLSCSRRPSCG